jgi:hypothetical protein
MAACMGETTNGLSLLGYSAHEKSIVFHEARPVFPVTNGNNFGTRQGLP